MSSKNIYANTVAEYQARRLFGREKLRRIADANFSDAVRMLIGYGYSGDYDNADTQDIDDFIDTQIHSLTEFVKENSASDALAKILLNSFNYSKTQAVFADNSALAEKIGVSSLIRYCKRQIDITNILTAYRAKKLGYNREETLSELFEGGEIDFESITLINDLKETIYDEAVTALEAGDLQSFRRLTEDLLLETLKKDSNNFMSYGPFIKYIFTQMEEYRTVRYILVCIKNNISFSVDNFRSIDDD